MPVSWHTALILITSIVPHHRMVLVLKGVLTIRIQNKNRMIINNIDQ
jgi:hypothetical protein